MPKKTLFLHCGAPKTGTSYLQVLFARYSAQMAERGVIYPRNDFHEMAEAGKITSGNGIELANYLNPGLPHKISNKDAFPKHLIEVLRAAGEASVLYSSEFITFQHQKRAEFLAKVVADAGYAVRVIFFVRDLGAAAVSSYSQSIKRHGDVRDFAKFLETWDPRWLSHIEAMIQTFGEDAVTILNYERCKTHLAQVMFEDVLGLDFVPEEAPQINRSLTAMEIELLRIMNQTYPEQQKVRLSTFVSDTLMGLAKDPAPLQLTAAHYTLLRTRFAETIAGVNAHIQGPGIIICDHVARDQDAPQLGEFEQTVMTVLARLVTAVNLHKH